MKKVMAAVGLVWIIIAIPGLYSIVRKIWDGVPVSHLAAVAIALTFTGAIWSCLRDVCRWWRA